MAGGITTSSSGGVDLHIGWEAYVQMAIDKERKRLSGQLASAIRSNWSPLSKHVKITVVDLRETVSIRIGTTRYASTHAHLIEFGGARHSPKSPTRRAIASLGYKVNWSNGGL